MRLRMTFLFGMENIQALVLLIIQMTRFKISWSLQYQGKKVVAKFILLLIKYCFWHFDLENGIFYNYIAKKCQEMAKKRQKK